MRCQARPRLPLGRGRMPHRRDRQRCYRGGGGMVKLVSVETQRTERLVAIVVDRGMLQIVGSRQPLAQYQDQGEQPHATGIRQVHRRKCSAKQTGWG